MPAPTNGMAQPAPDDTAAGAQVTGPPRPADAGHLLPAPLALADQALRVVTWNLETVGTPGSAPYQAVAAVLGRIDADVVAIQEVAGATDARNLQTLAQQLGYPYVEIAPGGPFGALRNALLSDFPITRSTLWTSVLLSGDAKANDLTRFLPEIRVDVTGRGDLLGLVSAHLKSASWMAAWLTARRRGGASTIC